MRAILMIVALLAVSASAGRLSVLRAQSKVSQFEQFVVQQTPFYFDALSRPESAEFVELMNLLIPSETAELTGLLEADEHAAMVAFRALDSEEAEAETDENPLGGIVDKAKDVGGKVVNGAKAAGSKAVAGAKAAGSKAVAGAKAAGSKAVAGAKAAGAKALGALNLGQAFVQKTFNKYKCPICYKVMPLLLKATVGDPNKTFGKPSGLICQVATKAFGFVCPKAVAAALTAAVSAATGGAGAISAPVMFVASRGICMLASPFVNKACTFAVDQALKAFPAAKNKLDKAMQSKFITSIKNFMQPGSLCTVVKMCAKGQSGAWPSKISP